MKISTPRFKERINLDFIGSLLTQNFKGADSKK
jgi:hypothetical protein